MSCPRIILSKSLEVQEVREMGRYQEVESEGFPGLGIKMMVDCFQADGKVRVNQDRLTAERSREEKGEQKVECRALQ